MTFHVLEQPGYLCILGMDSLVDLGCLIDISKKLFYIGGTDGLKLNFIRPEDLPKEWNLQQAKCTIQ
eukprot:UN00572